MRRAGTDTLLLLAAALLAWQALHLLAGPEGLASPIAAARRVAELMGTHGFWMHVAASGTAFGYALAVAVLGGLALGLLLGYFRTLGEVLDPIIGAIYSIPKITLYPVILLLFGLTLSAKVAFGAIHGLFPVLIFTINGVSNIRGSVLKTARVLGLGSLDTMRSVMLPAALPEIFSGMRICFSATLLGTLIGELFASDRGLGFMLIRSIEHNDSETIMAISVLLITISASVGAALLAVDRRIRRRL